MIPHPLVTRNEGLQCFTWQGQLWAPAIVPEERTYSRDRALTEPRTPHLPQADHTIPLCARTPRALREACLHTQMLSETAVRIVLRLGRRFRWRKMVVPLSAYPPLSNAYISRNSTIYRPRVAGKQERRGALLLMNAKKTSSCVECSLCAAVVRSALFIFLWGCSNRNDTSLRSHTKVGELLTAGINWQLMEIFGLSGGEVLSEIWGLQPPLSLVETLQTDCSFSAPPSKKKKKKQQSQ